MNYLIYLLVTVAYAYLFHKNPYQTLTWLSLADLLEKGATAEDPGRIINISSVASVNAHAEGSEVADTGRGLWSCKVVGDS